MKSPYSYTPLTPRSPFAIDRSLILPIALLSTLLLGVILHCGYHFLQHIHILDPIFPSGIASLTNPTDTQEDAQLYVSSYNGVITTLNFTEGKLKAVEKTKGCGGSPSWLTYNQRNVVYCLDEGLESDKGAISSFELAESEHGKLERLDQMATELGPVSAVVFGDESDGLAVAHYGGSALTTWSIRNPKFLTPMQTFKYSLPHPGPNPNRQEAPHPHQVVLDPTRRFLLVPDLGADLIRIYLVDGEEYWLTKVDPLVVAPGSGPRHLSFAVAKERTFMYVVTELANTVVGYEVLYEGEGHHTKMTFDQVWSSGIHGGRKAVPEGAAASEIIISPDSKFLIIASRNESTFTIPNLDATNNTHASIPSDPLINFAIEPDTGHLALLQEVPCGGSGPRQFSMNKAGTLVAIGLQDDGRVVILERDAGTGMLGDVEFLSWTDVEGQVTAVVFKE
ncbi:Fc.00g089950.m01.CDS01 [Cosmosporella sp. VM-42]